MSSAHHRPVDDGPSPAIQFALVWFVIAAQLVLTARLFYLTGPGDPDDAMRLLEVRNLLSGRGWFDLHEPRIAPPLGYDTHWSRLVDGGLALLHRLFEPFVGTMQAEFLMRMIWPLLCLAVALAAMLAIARHLAGDKGLLAAGFIAMFGFHAYYRFLPGRIDHHCVQVMLVVSALYLAIAAEARPRAGAAAGVVTAIALAVGLESLPFLAIAGASLVVQYLREARQARALTLYGLGLSAGTLGIYAATVAPARWLMTACDALAFNLVVPLAALGAGLAVLAPLLARHTPLMRGIALAMLAGLVGTVMIMLEPRCLGGPFEMVSPEARREWLDNVAESLPLLGPGRIISNLELVLPVMVSSLVIASLLLSRQVRGSIAALTVLATFAVATVIAIGNIKMTAYAAWFSLPLLSLAATLVWSRFAITQLWQRAGIALLLAPFTAAIIAFAIKITAVMADPATEEHRRACRPDEYKVLAALAPGLVLADVDAGPAILLNTPHAIWAAPYHRLSQQIAETMHVFAMPAAEAESAVLATGASYVVVCRQPSPGRTPPQTLEEALLAGHPPAWLTPVPVAGDKLQVYRTRLAPP